jgi:glycosyltransferase involved in cell wall biosynthesis
VSVLIPTLDRYDYLAVLLGQISELEEKPLEVLVVDQTPAPRRATDLKAMHPELNLTVIPLDTIGQSSARNEGLRRARGKYVLFLDDDDEISSDLIQRHLETLCVTGAQVSCGVVDELGAGPLPEAFRRRRVSDVFPTNNALALRDPLLRVGGFDSLLDQRQSEDFDLGVRLHAEGLVMFLDPTVKLFHHHAPRGGLRSHGQRVTTYASSRSTLWARNLLTDSEIYIGRKYFTRKQVREALWLSILGTFSVRGSALKKAAKVAVAFLLLPDTLSRLRLASRRANVMLQTGPIYMDTEASS